MAFKLYLYENEKPVTKKGTIEYEVINPEHKEGEIVILGKTLVVHNNFFTVIKPKESQCQSLNLTVQSQNQSNQNQAVETDNR
jgi:hypothetical protein